MTSGLVVNWAWIFGAIHAYLPSHNGKVDSWRGLVPWGNGDCRYWSGYWVTTPLQLAASTLPIATQGILREPVMVKSGSGPLNRLTGLRNLKFLCVILPIERTVIMEDVMHGALGTARRVGAEARYRIAGKTGTAQVRSLGEEEEYDEETIEERFRDHALFVGFAPVDQPEVVISVVVENGGGGSSTAAPIAKQVLTL